MVLNGDPPIEVKLRRSARARRLSLRVSSLDGRVTLTLPRFAPMAAAERFLDARQDWIAGALAGVPEQVTVRPGIELPVGGRLLRVTAGTGRAAVRQDDHIAVPDRHPGPALKAYLKTEARAQLAAACDHHAASLGRPYSALTLRDTRSRWGSCTEDGRLMFSWRLAMAPPQILNYVAAHEVAHLEHMDHSRAFWDTVDRLDPEWEEARAWLRSDGTALHRYRFED